MDCSPAEALHPSHGEPSRGACRTSLQCGVLRWYVASWNVGTLLDVESSIETARKGCHVIVEDERKIDQVVSELDRYHVVMTGLRLTGL